MVFLFLVNLQARDWAQQTSEMSSVEHEKMNAISTSKHVLFCYRINATAPYQIEKSILSMNQQ